MKNKVIQILKITSEEYDDLIWQTYWNWCKKYATSENNAQSLLANAALNRWFLMQYGQLEKKFVDLIAYFPKQVNDPDYHYKGITVEIFSLHPQPIIDSLKKKNPEFSFSINPTTIIYGN